MQMPFDLANSRQSLDSDSARKTSLVYLTANLATPGVGSITAGRRVGYFQLALTSIAVGLTLYFGGRFIVWFLQNRERLYSPDSDPLETLFELWLAVRWAFLGMGLFAVSLCWSLVTSLSIRREMCRKPSAEIPPKMES